MTPNEQDRLDCYKAMLKKSHARIRHLEKIVAISSEPNPNNGHTEEASRLWKIAHDECVEKLNAKRIKKRIKQMMNRRRQRRIKEAQ